VFKAFHTLTSHPYQNLILFQNPVAVDEILAQMVQLARGPATQYAARPPRPNPASRKDGFPKSNDRRNLLSPNDGFPPSARQQITQAPAPGLPAALAIGIINQPSPLWTDKVEVG
jgi:hypothetical protein